MARFRSPSWLGAERLFARPPVVAVVRLGGVIGTLGPWRGGLTLAGLAPTLERAFRLRRLSAVALVVNSPGGSPVQSALIAKRIRDLAAEQEVPVFAFVEDVAASGGYWLATAAEEIYAQESSIVGSIGVISAGFGFQALLEKFGIERRLHTAGERKSMLDPFLPEKPEDLERLAQLQAEVHESFKAQVRDRRQGRLKAAEEELFSGEFWSGKRAVELGLIDGLAELREEMRRRFGDKVRLRALRGQRSWLRRRSRLGAVDWPEPEDWARGLIAAAEERALWSRFGL
jgi:signal peptide peptidase SppA